MGGPSRQWTVDDLNRLTDDEWDKLSLEDASALFGLSLTQRTSVEWTREIALQLTKGDVDQLLPADIHAIFGCLKKGGSFIGPDAVLARMLRRRLESHLRELLYYGQALDEAAAALKRRSS